MENKSELFEYNDLFYLLNEEEKTASLVGFRKQKDNLYIPRSIYKEGTEYVIKKISQGAFRCYQFKETIQFAPDSEIQIIESEAFIDSSIKIFPIPQSITLLQPGCFQGIMDLSQFQVSPSNIRYKAISDNRILLSKSNTDQDKYDTLVYYIKSDDEIFIKIPNFIEKIEPNFTNIDNIEIGIEFENGSMLKSIQHGVFSDSRMTTFSLPSSVTHIFEGSFKNCFNLNQFIIEKESKLEVIEKDAFSNTKIEYLYIPKDVTELKCKWCRNIRYLEKVEVSKNNKRFSSIDDDSIVVGNSIENDQNFNILVFCGRNKKTIEIPQNIEIIGSYSLSDCRFDSIEFENNSKLRIIEKGAFSNSSIQKIQIPSQITQIGSRAFYDCDKLLLVDIRSDSKIQIIQKKLFSNTKISTFSVPPQVTRICEGAFSNCPFLTEVIIDENSNLQLIEKNSFLYSSIKKLIIMPEFVELEKGWCRGLHNVEEIKINPKNKRYLTINDGKIIIGKSNVDSNIYDFLVFSVRDITECEIPNFIETIGLYSFNFCDKLNKITFQSDSKLKLIDKYAFANSSIKEITIPSSVTQLNERSFSYCEHLFSLGIESNSNLKIIEKSAFIFSGLREFTAPSSLIEIGDFVFNYTNLGKINFEPGSKLKKIGRNCFYKCQIEKFDIPSEVVEISDGTFSNCKKLKSFIIPKKSKLKIIGNGAFSESSIEKISIPSSLTTIKKGAFDTCLNLSKFEIPQNSQLSSIGDNAFMCCGLTSFCFPSNLTKIGQHSFYKCRSLQKVFMPPDLKIDEIDKFTFAYSSLKCFSLPASVSRMYKCFTFCEDLILFEIGDDSKITEIDDICFHGSSNITLMISAKLNIKFNNTNNDLIYFWN